MGLSTWINMTLPHLHWLLTLYKCSKETEREADKHKRRGPQGLFVKLVCVHFLKWALDSKEIAFSTIWSTMAAFYSSKLHFFFFLHYLGWRTSLAAYQSSGWTDNVRHTKTHTLFAWQFKILNTALWVCVFCSKCFVLIHMHLASYTTNRLINQHQAKPSNHFALWNESPKWALWCNSPHWNPRKRIYIWQRVYLYGVFKLSTHDWRAGGRNQFLQRGKAFSPQRGGT